MLGAFPLRKLRAHPHGLLVDREKPGDFLNRRIRTPSRKVELFPRDVYAPLGELAASLESVIDPERPVLRLFTKRERLGHNSWMHSNRALPMSEQRAYLSASDATRLGLVSGQRVRLSTDSGAIELPIEVSSDVVAGAVAVTHGYGHDEQSGWHESKRRGGQNVNLLAASGPAAVDPLTGMCRFVGVPVRVEALPAEADAVSTQDQPGPSRASDSATVGARPASMSCRLKTWNRVSTEFASASSAIRAVYSSSRCPGSAQSATSSRSTSR